MITFVSMMHYVIHSFSATQAIDFFFKTTIKEKGFSSWVFVKYS